MHQSNVRELGKYYTNTNVSRLLVDGFFSPKPNLILELGVGNGALLSQAARRWIEAQYYTADIDAEAAIFEFAIKNHKHQKIDVLSVDLSNKLGLGKRKADISICNPPYIRTEWKKAFEEILEDSGLSGTVPSIKDTTADVLFLAQNLRLLRSGGELGIIVPEGLIVGERLECVRSEIVKNHAVSRVIQLPINVFKNTEAQTYILMLTKNGVCSDSVPLFIANKNGTLGREIVIPQENAIQRMDFKHYRDNIISKSNSKKVYILGSGKKEDLVRGSVTWKVARFENIRCFHTVHFKDINNRHCFSVAKKFRASKSDKLTYRTAIAGDILIARVGRSLHEQCLLIDNGEMVISDCIYRLRLPLNIRRKVWNFLDSSVGKVWLEKHVKGVCAKYICKADILRMPI